ncbi:MAG: tetratricopeptide repeat protein, partial [Bacteroidetes bacterium]|nr:tetratricopeptide repeat protein [Bacteroidota bacterium]
MKSPLWYLILILLYPLCCVAQQTGGNPIVDSLFQRIAIEKNDSTIVEMYENIIVEYFETNPVQCIQYANKAIAIAEKINMQEDVAYLHRLIGHCYFNISDYPKALKYFFTALKYDETKGDKLNAAFDMNSLAKTYRKENEYDKALEYYRKAWEINEQDKRKRDIGNHIQGIGIVFQELKQYDSALVYYLKALDAQTKYKNDDGIKKAKINIGTAYLHLSQYDLAEKYLLEGLETMKKDNNIYGIALTANNLTDLYNEMANPPEKVRKPISEKNKHQYFQQAISYARLSIEKSEELGEWDLRESAYLGMSTAQAGLGNYKEALESFQKHKLYKDSIYNENSKAEIVNFTLQREMDIKNREMEERENELKFHFSKKEDSLKYAQNLADLRIKEQSHLLLLSNQNLTIAYKEKDLQHLAYLKTQLELSNQQAMTAEKEKEIRLAKLEADQKEQDIQLARKEALLQAVG